MEAVTNVNLKSQFLETELIWVIHRSHRAWDWRDIISSEDSTLVRMTTNNYHMLSLCMECISAELFHSHCCSSLFANSDLFPSCTMDSKQQANNLLYSKGHKQDIFSRTWRKLFPEENKEESQNLLIHLWKVKVQMSQGFYFLLTTFKWVVKLPST